MFLYDFTLFVIDMHPIMLISLFSTSFDHFHFHGFLKSKRMVILKSCHIWYWQDRNSTEFFLLISFLKCPPPIAQLSSQQTKMTSVTLRAGNSKLMKLWVECEVSPNVEGKWDFQERINIEWESDQFVDYPAHSFFFKQKLLLLYKEQ